MDNNQQRAKDISVGANNDPWIVDRDTADIYKWQVNTWVKQTPDGSKIDANSS
jgi:hypothetical protein